MAENDQDEQDKTEQPTPKRLDEARKKGDIPRSRDLSSAAVMMMGGIGFSLLGAQIGTDMSEMVRSSLSLSPDAINGDGVMTAALSTAMLKAALACAPIVGLIMLAAAIAPLALGGWSFSGEALTPKFERLSPLNGFKRMFSTTALVELMKSLAKFSVVALAAVLVLRAQTGELLALGSEPTKQAVVHAFKMCGQAFIILSAGLLIIAAADVPYQLWQYAKKLRMSRHDIKQEMKESEGSPEIKGRIRQLQREIAQRRMMEDVPKADVVVTNPTHFAVALRYDDQRMRAPIVVAKGADHVAAKIRELADAHKVPIFEAPPLARTLHRHVEIGGEIPQRLYVAVAQVLTYIFQLRAAMQGAAIMPHRPDIDMQDIVAAEEAELRAKRGPIQGEAVS
jgi:flagellar biosynthetic protein FlhB